ncbi:hypothetical protein HpSP79_01030 [Helicobacter pylori]
MNHLQQRVNTAQETYDAWCALLPELEADLARFEQAAILVGKLTAFAQNEFLELYDAIENGAPADLATGGNLSVMNQDAVWDACTDFRRVLLARLKQSVAALEAAG